jgi:hypothetical protein
MDQIPITGLEDLERHLQQLVEAPDTPLDAKLFDEVELQLTGKLYASWTPLSFWSKWTTKCPFVEGAIKCFVDSISSCGQNGRQ